MKKLTIITALWTMFLALSLNAEKLEIVNGGFKVGEFSMPAFDGEKNSQLSPTKQTADAAEFKASKFAVSQKIAKKKNGSFKIETKISGESKNFFYRTKLPTPIYKTECILINGERAQCGDYEATSSVKIELVDGVLSFRGAMKAKVYRRYEWPFVRLYAEVYPIFDSDGKCDLDVSYRDNAFQPVAIDKKYLNAKTEKLLPAGGQKIQWVWFKIPENLAAAIHAGQGIVIPFNKSAKFLYVIASADSIPNASEVATASISSKEGEFSHKITAKNIGLFNSPEVPKDAVLAWSCVRGGKPLNVYMLEIPMPRGRIDKVVLRSNADLKIYAATFSKNSLKSKFANQQITAESDVYKPVEFKRPFKRGSALDMSWILDAPAGKYGRVIARDGDFFFEKAPEKRVRFYGANICMSCSVPSKRLAEKLADDFALRGYNIVRFHHFDFLILKDGGRSSEFDADALDRMFYLWAKFRERGIYITTDLFTMRKLSPEQIPEFPAASVNDDNKGALMFTKSGKALLKRFAKDLLCTKNPYTGLAMKDDPALVSLSIVNENSFGSIDKGATADLLQKRYKAYLAENKLSHTDAREAGFMKSEYMKYYVEMRDYLRSIGVKTLLTDQNFNRSYFLSVIADNYDVVDTHAYQDHPTFLLKDWRNPQIFNKKHSFAFCYGGAFVRTAYNSHLYKPMTVTEWDYLLNGGSGTEGAFIVAANAAFQNFDMLCRFTYSHDARAIESGGLVGGFDIAGDPLRAVSEIAASMLFIRGDVATSNHVVPLLLPADIFETDLPFVKKHGHKPYHTQGGNYADLSQLVKMGTIVYKKPEDIKLPENAVAAVVVDESLKLNVPTVALDDPDLVGKILALKKSGKAAFDTSAKTQISSTGETFIDAEKLSFKVQTARSEVLAGQPAAELSGNFARVKFGESKAVVMVSSLDAAPLTDSKRILVIYLTDLKNSDTRWQDGNILIEYGRQPLLIRTDKAHLSLSKNFAGYKLYALDTDGSRLREVPLSVSGANTSAVLDNYQDGRGVFAFELVKE